MSEQKPELTPVTERSGYPPILNVAIPLIILIVSAAYAWSLRDVVNPEMNLLLLRPLFVAIWVLLIIVVIKDVNPSVRVQREWSKASSGRSVPWRERFAPGTEAGAGLVVAATFAFALFGPGDGPIVYLINAFVYLAAVGYLTGDRKPVRLITQAAIFSAGLYLVMGVILGVRL